jgi:hypothetical protein
VGCIWEPACTYSRVVNDTAHVRINRKTMLIMAVQSGARAYFPPTDAGAHQGVDVAEEGEPFAVHL